MAFALLFAYVAAAMAFAAACGGSAVLALMVFAVSVLYSWANHAKGDTNPTLLLALHTAGCTGILVIFLTRAIDDPTMWTLPVAWWLGMFWSWRRITAKP